MAYKHSEFLAQKLHNTVSGSRVRDLGNDTLAVISTTHSNAYDDSILGWWSDRNTYILPFIDRVTKKLYGTGHTQTFDVLAMDYYDEDSETGEKVPLLLDDQMERDVRKALPQFDKVHSKFGYTEQGGVVHCHIIGSPVLAHDLYVAPFFVEHSYKRYWLPDNEYWTVNEMVSKHERHERFEAGEWCGINVQIEFFFRGVSLKSYRISSIASDSSEGQDWVNKSLAVFDLTTAITERGKELLKAIEELGLEVQSLLLL